MNARKEPGRPAQRGEIGSRNKVGEFDDLLGQFLLACQPYCISRRRMRVTCLLIFLLPLVLPTTVVYYPILPFPRLPMLMTPSLYPKMGNRPFDKTIERQESPSGYHTCHDHTAEWHEWEAGSSGTIKVKRNGSRLASTPWDLKLVFNHPVNLQVMGGQFF